MNCMVIGEFGFSGNWISLGAHSTHKMSDFRLAMHKL